MQWNPHHQQYSPSYPSLFSPQAYQTNQAPPPAYYQFYHYATTNHSHHPPAPHITYPPPPPQITYPLAVPQITYLVQNNHSQIKNEANPPSPPLPQTQEPQQPNEAFPTHGTILTIIRGSNTDFNTKRQCRDYYREVNHVAIKGPITRPSVSHSHNLLHPRCQPNLIPSHRCDGAHRPHRSMGCVKNHCQQW
jgi:hypothetical protein